MNCFNHPQTSAIGICKACSKGLCIECATDLGHGLACRNKHESMVETYNEIIMKNAKVYSSAPKNIYLAPAFYLFMGLAFSGFALNSAQGMHSLGFVLGVGFIVFGIVSYVKAKALFSDKPTT